MGLIFNSLLIFEGNFVSNFCAGFSELVPCWLNTEQYQHELWRPEE